MIVAGTAGRRDLDWGGHSRSQVVPEPKPWQPDGVRHTTHSDERGNEDTIRNSYSTSSYVLLEHPIDSIFLILQAADDTTIKRMDS